MGNQDLRLIWPQWQGAGSTSIDAFKGDLSFEVVRQAYSAGTNILQSILPTHEGPSEVVPPTCDNNMLLTRDGIEAKEAVVSQLRNALKLIDKHDPLRITTLGGDCSVSVAPFSTLAAKYGDNLAIIWVDSHPDVDTGETEYDGYHAMAVSALTGHGDQEIVNLLPATVAASRVALVGLHEWTEDAYRNVETWGLTVFPPDALRTKSDGLLNWLTNTGATKVAIHLDVDTIDAAEVRFGLGTDFGGLTSTEAKRVIADINRTFEVVGFTVAEYIPWQVLHLQQVLNGMPLLS
jgi:Arginase/agmatinase/formimionoglutamate hydrolase, arginase family